MSAAALVSVASFMAVPDFVLTGAGWAIQIKADGFAPVDVTIAKDKGGAEAAD